MCGIGVVIGEDKDKTFITAKILKNSLKHRGPDADGLEILQTRKGSYIGFAHTRLSILDLSQQGQQPMTDEVTGSKIVFNGEIYNYREIKLELEALGESFFSTSDTEVILKGCRRFGFDGLLTRLRGMYAFAWWDEVSQILQVARDPMGIKPLYFCTESGKFYLSSELKAFKSAEIIETDIDINSLDTFLAFGSVQPPGTIYTGVFALMPGHKMNVTVEGIPSVQSPFYSLSDSKPEISDVKSSLERSIKRHLISDVPLGIMLSGGFDSTALACISSKVTTEPITAFTLNFPETPEYTEHTNAKNIANHLNLDHEILDITKNDVVSSLQDYFTAMDQPSDDGLNIFLISKRIKENGIKACLHGAGGDELFGGYPSFRDVPLFLKLSYIPKKLRKILSKFIAGESVEAHKLSDLLEGDINIISSYLIRRSLFSFTQRERLLGFKPPMGRIGTSRQWINIANKAIEGKTLDKSISALELLQYSANKLMVDGDVMSMAHGLELRVPLLDLDLIHSQHVFSNNFSKNRYLKTDLINAVDNFPHELINKKKAGFTIPIKYWLSEFITHHEERVIESLKNELNMSELELKKIFSNMDALANKGEKWVRPWQLFSLGMWLDSNT